MLRLDLVTIFPRMLEAPLDEGIVRRARDRGLVEIRIHDLREHTDDERHRTVDDAPFGGGPGMVMRAEPYCRAVETLLPEGVGEGRVVALLSPRGRSFDQATAERYAGLERLVLLAGRYEGVDERVAAHLASEEVSLGDFVLTGGEVAALAIAEAVTRLVPGALGDAESALADSFADGLLDHPHYTRPAELRGWSVPEVLLSGDHARIARWRRKQALKTTLERRPELLEAATLSEGDARLLREIENEERQQPLHAS
jgi:tRNA (guanine37-N1)-methyltransferase